MVQSWLSPVIMIAPFLIFPIYWILRFALCALKRCQFWKISFFKTESFYTELIAVLGVERKQDQEKETPVLPHLYSGILLSFKKRYFLLTLTKTSDSFKM